mmetsp:Transcript_36331/g.117053  ORF Transcript_36331/g.117053 Transcript_36331/m.117053 type:complete len:449 (+) Transcript_36331:2-1348(+)
MQPPPPEEPPPPPPEEPSHLCCPITHTLFRDPVFVPESGTTYERAAIVHFWSQPGERRDALTNIPIRSDVLYTNWGKRREVAAWLAENPEHMPHGWRSRDDMPAAQPPPDRRPRRLLLLARRVRSPTLKTCACIAVVGTAVGSGFGIPLDAISVGVAAGAQPLPSQPTDASCRASGYGVLSQREPTSHGVFAAMVLMGVDSRTSRRPSVPTLMRLGALPSRLQVSVLRSPASEAADDAHDALPVTEKHTFGMMRQYTTFAAAHGLRLDVPHAPLTSLFSGSNAAGLFFLAFTAMWTSNAWRADAPILVTLFSCPFWHVGASLLATSLGAIFHRSTLALHEGGIQVERQGTLFGDVGGVLGDLDALRSSTCMFVPWSELLSGSLENALQVQTTQVVNGVESGILEVRTVRGALAWTSGDLTLDELRKVRELLLLWARERGLGAPENTDE